MAAGGREPDAASSPPPPADAANPNEAAPAPLAFPVVGLVASAGGLDALRKFFTAMPADSGLAFLVVPHLDPSHESLMVELLARDTRMPVREAAEGQAVEANHVYLIPPNKYLTLRGGTMRLRGPVERGTAQTAIDIFLRSLAEDQQEKAICVILSGTGAHGTLGLRAVKANGGMAMVQEPHSAEHDRMPQSAIATGLADYVLPPEQMPEALTGYVRHVYVNGDGKARPVGESPDYVQPIMELLREQTNYDFRCYRRKMLLRRVERRMSLGHVDDLAAYIDRLRQDPGEAKRLAKDLLISVTNFFRDPEVFQLLAGQVVSELIRGREPSQTLRVWVPGCATGEEAYSLAMLFCEEVTAAHKTCALKVYASDVDEDALEYARQGVYPESIAADVSPERLQRFFTRADEHSFQVSKQLRETVIFAAQNLITDAPFSKLDLISCRNLMIYLDTEVQQQVIALLHFALNEGGILLLGPSEAVGRQTDLFEPVSKKWRIFRRIGPTRWDRVRFPILSRLEADRAASPERPPTPRPPNFAELANQWLIREYAPAAVLISRKYEILYFHGPTGRFLDQPTGEPTQDLMQLAREGLGGKLRAAVHQAVGEDRPVTLGGVQVKRDGAYQPIQIRVQPVQSPKGAEGLLLVTFQDEPAPTSLHRTGDGPAVAADALVRQLEYELKVTQDDLQNSVEEMVRSNEELKASNEEVMSVNEELQSANEELETSKEELQSLNEELSAVNAQLQDKVEELERANNDLANLISSTDIAIVFLDCDFRIQRFTRGSTRLLNLIDGDVGRPLSDIAQKFRDDELLRDAEIVLRDLVPQEREVQTHDGLWCLRRILPYRTLDQHIEGVVITFTDVTQLKRAGEQQRRLAAVLMDSNDALMVQGFDGRILAWNRGAERAYSYAEAEALAMNVVDLVPEAQRGRALAQLQRLGRGENVDSLETQRVHKDGRVLDVWLTATPLRDEAGKPVAVVVTERDVTERNRAREDLEKRVEKRTAQLEAINEELQSEIAERRRAEEALLQSRDRFSAIVDFAAEGIVTIDERGMVESFNRAAERMFQYPAGEVVGRSVTLLMNPPYDTVKPDELAHFLKTRMHELLGAPREATARRKDGSPFPVELVISEFQDDGKRLFTGIVRDLSATRELEQKVLEVAAEEQRRIGQDLHDNTGQELTGLGLLAQSLAEALKGKSAPEARTAARVAEGLKLVLSQIREIARGLVPVEVDAGGLMAALGDLAARTSEFQAVACTFTCQEPVFIADNDVAMHLYRIAQEAVANALKHGQPKTIRIALESQGTLATLQIADDGSGIRAENLITKEMGLRIMRYRAGRIGGRVQIGPGPQGGTTVRCTFPRDNPHAET